MPTIRYEIRSEYGLADPELYRAADKDDPEALLEGVAMAGLVGVLRQLGDLAEFAAKIFHDLHDEVTATSARGHGLMLRVQQLEAEFPSIEKGLLNQTSHSHFAYNEGFDWHTNLRVDQNLVTQGDMPRFILDSYEECRGPPRLFMLDKFDVAGAGACLKRYSDPSFFRVNLSSSGLMEEEVQREMKARKIKKRTSVWKNGEAPESFLASLITPKLQPQSSNQVSSKVPTRHIKLKRRNLSDSDITSRKSYMKHLLENHSTEEKAWSEISIASSSLIVNSIDSSELTPQIPEIVSDTITDSTLVREGSPAESPTRKEVAYIPPKELENHQRVKSVQFSKSVRRKMTTPGSKTDNEKTSNVADEAEKSHSARADFTKEGAFDGDISNGYTPEVAKSNPTVLPELDSKTSLANVESTGEGDLDDHKSDDISSDLDNYMDALNTTGSETETDSENITKSDPLSKTGAHEMASGVYEQKNQFPIQLLQDSLEESITSNSVISHDLDNIRSLKHQSGSDVPAILDVKDTPEEAQDNFAFEECASSAYVLPSGTSNAKELDNTVIKSDIEEAPSGSCLLDSTSSHTNACCEGGDEAQLFTPLPDYREGTHVSQQSDFPVEEPSKDSNKSDTFSLEFAPLSEMGDSSFGTKDEGVHLAECVEEQNLGNKEGTADHLSRVMNESTFKGTSAQHIEESTVALFANSEGEQQDSLKQDAEICLNLFRFEQDAEIEYAVDSSDHFSRMMNESGYKDMSTQHVEGSTVVLIANSEGEQQTSLKQDAEICLDENLSSTILELPSETDPTTVYTEDLADMGYTEPSKPDPLLPLSEIPGKNNSSKGDEPIYSEDVDVILRENIPEDISVRHVEDSPVSNLQIEASQEPIGQDTNICFDEDTSPSYASFSLKNSQFTIVSDDFAVGGGVIAATGECSNTDDLVPSELENLSNSENPQESPKVNPAEILLSSGKENFSDGVHQHLNYGTEDLGEANTLIPNIEPLELGHCFHVMGPNESHVADPLEHKPMNVMYSDGMQLLSKEHDYMTSSNAEERKESHDITDTLEFPNGSTELNLQKAAVQQGKHTEDDDSVDEFVIVEADDIQDSSSLYSGKASGFDVQLQEDYLPHDSTLAQPDMEVTETSVQKNFTLLPQDEPQSITSAAVLSSGLPTKLFDSVCCPISSETNIGKESLIYSSENEDSASKDSPFTHSFVEAELSGDHREPNEECSNSEGEPNEISSHPEGEHLEALDTNEENIIQSIDRINADQPSKPEPYGIFSDSETNDLEVPLSSTSIHDNVKAESEPSIASKCNTEIPLTTLVSSISLSEIPSTQSSGENISETSPQEASELLPSEPSSSFQLKDIDETPPPPPLPPMEWRLGKLQFGSLTSSGDAVQHPVASNLFMELITGDEKYPANSFGSLPVEENERYRDGPPDVEIAQPSRLSQVPQIADEEGEKSSLFFKGGMVNLPNPVIIESHREDGEPLSGHNARVSQLSQGEGQSGQYKRPQLSHLLPSLELERSQHGEFSVVRNPVHPLNSLLVGPYEEEWKHQYGYGVYGGDSGQHLNLPAMLPNMPPYGFLYSLGENPSTVFDFMIPTVEGEKKYRSIRDRPRDPLIEAVAAHDKSTLRKVSELDLPSARPKTVERESLLEEIRNKAFNLKPANAPKPNIKGIPQTNLKVAAILEKANAIRQAFVGSDEDEDDDGDNWSDS